MASLTTRSRAKSEHSAATDQERDSYLSGPFRPVASYQNLPKNPLYQGIVVMHDASHEDYLDFLNHCKGSGIKSWRRDGTIVITELNTHKSHSGGAGFLSNEITRFHIENNLGPFEQLQEFGDATEKLTDETSMQPDASYGRRERPSASIFLEIANSQDPDALLLKGRRYVMLCSNLRVLLLAK